jgi:hypothetical protein
MRQSKRYRHTSYNDMMTRPAKLPEGAQGLRLQDWTILACGVFAVLAIIAVAVQLM